MERKITFNKKNNYFEAQLDPENPFFMVTCIEFPAVPKKSRNVHSLIPDYSIKTTTHNHNGNYHTDSIEDIPDEATDRDFFDVRFPMNKVLAVNPENTKVTLEFINNSENDDDVIITYTTFNKFIDLSNPFEAFHNHIKQPDNIKILFSAPFGQGKTTFINHYFETHKTTYEVFKLYPVNYAVSHNEDIFKYIKAEILFQLMGKDVEFDKMKFNYLEVGFDYFGQNADKIISSLLPIIPKIGKSAANVFDKLFELGKAIKEHKSKVDFDRQHEALSYINDLYQKEGSIFEDNFYTQLIRELLEQHKENHKRQNVLIIDDLDRMDPDHIFRIFNVFAAHFDSPERESQGLTNKFGFDKIILVCDYTNIQAIFAHRYGSTTSLYGYLSKYFSKSPFVYDNALAARVLINNIATANNTIPNSIYGYLLEHTLTELICADVLTLRELIKLQKYNYYESTNRLSNFPSRKFNTFLSYLPYFVVSDFLENIYPDFETILVKLNSTKSKLKARKAANYTKLTILGMPSALNNKIVNGATTYIHFNNDNYTFNLQLKNEHPYNIDYYAAINVVCDKTGEKYQFTNIDFIDMLILNTEIYFKSKETD